jgi:hypothetical protein
MSGGESLTRARALLETEAGHTTLALQLADKTMQTCRVPDEDESGDYATVYHLAARLRSHAGALLARTKVVSRLEGLDE